MATIRMLQPLDYDAAAKLSDEVFRNEEQMSMAHSFSYLFSPITAHSFGAFEDGVLLAHMGLLPSIVRVGRSKLPVFSLGSVCTSEAARGKGFGTDLLHKVQEHVDSTGAVMMFVSGGRSLYTRNRCYSFGKTHVYTITPDGSAVAEADVQARVLTENDCFAWYELAQQREAAFDFSLWDMHGLEHGGSFASCVMMKPKVYVLERNGQVTAYIYLMKPSSKQPDAPSHIYEYGGTAEEVLLLMQLVMKQKQIAASQIYVPWQDKEMIALLGNYALEEAQNQGTLYIPSMERLFRYMKNWWIDQGALAANIQVTDLEGGNVRLEYPGAESIELAESQLLSLLFDPKATNLLPPAWPSAEQLKITIPLPYTIGLYYI
ncbi:GNAT family N-acetyltransferase [Paenibacillus alvei]|uniref:GNAT family N-acetyltransferase n=2 Tax=Paenibacillus TaxID=44249 RepID=A0ABT4GT83_PAEAL|nr:GNAT family N-acetyltransferase [Paenibacillus alvei]EJW17966.1 acetyltransferase, GNAT family [Paenibacillus alvei DSM 29]MCY9544668.1 GNAT family N-acetyltransferase [Paenibacillus alvei]MCY9703470.1 GNAT family N-acetyltransferase [Paenibacillus alvei]MCY9732352.1 GNAT family N-acetyltransferase [Paenibacillus alvei]MCY9754591.1 GNAT family N-acetyltransferase [Paenibacillus alvei]